jgi:hypothetical protein
VFYWQSIFTRKKQIQNQLDNDKLYKMEGLTQFPFQTIDWEGIEKTTHAGETGMAYWQTIQLLGLRLRKVEYSPDYLADHWCQKGHIVHCISGTFVSELENGEMHTLTSGMTYVVSDEMSSHRSISKEGVILLIIDRDFLK